MATKAWIDPEFRRSTTFEDLIDILSCTTRLSILLSLSGGPMRPKDLVRWLGFTTQHLSNHLTMLRQNGIVDFEGEGSNHFYRLARPAPIQVVRAGLKVSLKADDGSPLSGLIVKSSPMMRTLERAIAASKAKRRKAPASPGIVIVRRRPQDGGQASTDGEHIWAS